ncbi:MAG: phenylacetate--CoA ligase family protein [Planctomycetes bacterium]|nr:phenylacetate--CoA ligase family protein [Planctomycetota bacterium]
MPLQPPSHPGSELLHDRPRRHYLGQLWRYALPMARWTHRLRQHHRAPAEYRDRFLPEALRGVLCAAQTQTAHYAETFHRAGVQWRDLRSVDDLVHFPALSRREAQEKYEDLLSRNITLCEREEGIVWRTSGSTGQPVRFFVNGETNKFPYALMRFWMGRRSLRPFSHGVVLLCSLPRSVLCGTWLPLFGGTYFRKIHGSEPGAGPLLTRLAPAVITGDPHSLVWLDGELRASRVLLRSRLIVSSAFALSPELSKSLSEWTGARVIDCYSLAETGPLAFRCGPDRSFHLLGAAAVLETDVHGEILVTNLRNPFFPLVRYRTGDLGRIVWEPCECGYRGPSLVRLEGRLAARFIATDGRKVDPSQVEPILTRLPVRQFQLVQTGPLAVTLRYHGPVPIREASEVAQVLGLLLGGGVELICSREAEPLWRGGEKPVPYLRAASDSNWRRSR